MKILQLIAPAPAGGAESAVRSLAVGLRASGADVSVAALLPPSGANPFVDGLRQEGVEVHEIRHPHRSYRAQTRDVTALIEAEGVDVLHTHVYHADVVGCFATRGTGCRWLSTVHGLPAGDLKNRLYIAVDMFVLRRADAVLCVAESVREIVSARGVPVDRIHLVPNGYAPVPTVARDEARAELGIEGPGPTVGWIGRLSPEKGGDLLLEALADPAGAGVSAVIVGDGPERAALEAESRRLGLGTDRVVFAGKVDGAARLMAAFDCLVISSRTEGTPMVLLEAMAAGVPVVSFAVGGIPDVIDSDSGMLVDPEDVTGLAAAIGATFEDDVAARERAETAERVFASRYSVDGYVRRTKELYRAMTESDATSARSHSRGNRTESAE